MTYPPTNPTIGLNRKWRHDKRAFNAIQLRKFFKKGLIGFSPFKSPTLRIEAKKQFFFSPKNLNAAILPDYDKNTTVIGGLQKATQGLKLKTIIKKEKKTKKQKRKKNDPN